MAIRSNTFDTLPPAPDVVAELDREFENINKRTSLGDLVETAYDYARNWRMSNGVDEEIEYCLAAYQNRYTVKDREALGIDETNNIFAPLTSTKCMALMSWLHDIFSSAEDKPWTAEPTPVPMLPEDLQLLVQQKLVEEFQQATAQGLQVDAQMLADRTKELLSLAMNEARARARKAVDRMSDVIHDQLEEGGWRMAFDAFVKDLSIYPNAFMRGPFVTLKGKLVWDGNTIKEEIRRVMSVERVSPYDVFPSPDSTTTTDGAYIIERMFLTAADLYSLATNDQARQLGLRPEAINSLLRRNPDGFTYGEINREPGDNDDGKPQFSRTDESREYEVLVYYGQVREEVMRDFEAERSSIWSNTAAKETQELEVWVCDGEVMRIVDLKHPDNRPIVSTSFLSVSGSFWGRSLPMILRDIQRGANACLRSLVTNMAFSSGPIGEYDVDRLQNEDDISNIEPGRLYAIVNDVKLNQVASQPAIRFHNVDSHARELLGVYDRFEKMADDASGIPAYVIGSPQVAGAGRTLGGLAMLMGNAAKGVKRVVSNIDKHVIEPVVSRAFRTNMLEHSDQTIKADAQVVARGASGLLQRELQQARAVEILQLLTPYVQSGFVNTETINLLLRDIVRSLGYRPDEIGMQDPQRMEELQAYLQRMAAQGVTQPQVQPAAAPQAPNPLGQIMGTGLAGAPPQPQLDQRSAPPPNPADMENLPPA